MSNYLEFCSLQPFWKQNYFREYFMFSQRLLVSKFHINWHFLHMRVTKGIVLVIRIVRTLNTLKYKCKCFYQFIPRIQKLLFKRVLQNKCSKDFWKVFKMTFLMVPSACNVTCCELPTLVKGHVISGVFLTFMQIF